MRYRSLGKTRLKVSLVSFGTGGPSSFGQNKGLERSKQVAIIRRCLDLGINLFDTSAAYGRSEEILGEALKGIPRDSYVLATKWSHLGEDRKVIRDTQALAESVGRSLQLLGTDYVDVMLFHALEPGHYHDVVKRLYPAMERLRDQGKVRFIGFSERFILDPRHEAAVLALRTHPQLWDTIMLKYGILNQWAAREALPLALEHGVGIMNMAAVRIKLPNPELLESLIAEWKQRRLIPRDGLQESDPLGWLVRGEVDSVIGAGYKFAADHPGVSTVLTGTSSVEHLEHNVAAIEKPSLPQADNERLVQLFSEIAEYA